VATVLARASVRGFAGVGGLAGVGRLARLRVGCDDVVVATVFGPVSSRSVR
jgi:hypothetical protein